MKTLSHEEARARLMELVYPESAESLRAPIQAHVTGCKECQADVAALSDTRVASRAALDDAPVPPRVRARILEGAAAATVEDEKARRAADVQATQTAPTARVPRVTAGPSFWERFRGRWAFPSLAAAGALALMLIGSKVFMNPDGTLERGREGLVPRDPPATQPTPGGPAPVAEVTPADRREKQEKQGTSEGQPGEPRNDERIAERALSPAARAAIERTRSFGPRPGAGLFGHSKVSARLAGAPASRALQNVSVGGLGKGAGAAGSAQGLGGVSSNTASAAAPELQEDAKAEPAPRALAKEKTIAGPSQDQARPMVAPSSRAPAEAPAELAESPRAPSPAKASARQAKSEARGTDSAPAAGFETLSRRADDLYAAHRWSEAAAAYRELLRRFPDADPVPRWRTRLTQAQRELAPREAPAATSAPSK